MSITRIFKTTAVHNPALTTQPAAGKEKFFTDPMCAAFHIKSHANTFSFQITPCDALKEDGTYYLVSKATQDFNDVRHLARNQKHTVYIITIQTGGDYSNSSDVYIKTEPRTSYDEKRTVFIDANGHHFWVNDKVEITPTPLYLPYASTIDEISTLAAKKAAQERQSQLAYVAQLQAELKRKQAELDLEVATLAGDAEYDEVVVAKKPQ